MEWKLSGYLDLYSNQSLACWPPRIWAADPFCPEAVNIKSFSSGLLANACPIKCFPDFHPIWWFSLQYCIVFKFPVSFNLKMNTIYMLQKSILYQDHDYQNGNWIRDSIMVDLNPSESAGWSQYLFSSQEIAARLKSLPSLLSMNLFAWLS